MSVPICEHIKDNGERCASPALRDQHLCYFHSRLRAPKSRPGDFDYRFPVLDSPHAILIATTHIAQAVIDGSLDEKRARFLMNTLRMAMSALRMIQAQSKQNSCSTDIPVCAVEHPQESCGTEIPVCADDSKMTAHGERQPETAAHGRHYTENHLAPWREIYSHGPEDALYETATRILKRAGAIS